MSYKQNGKYFVLFTCFRGLLLAAAASTAERLLPWKQINNPASSHHMAKSTTVSGIPNQLLCTASQTITFGLKDQRVDHDRHIGHLSPPPHTARTSCHPVFTLRHCCHLSSLLALRFAHHINLHCMHLTADSIQHGPPMFLRPLCCLTL